MLVHQTCDWTGEMEVEIRVAETESILGEEKANMEVDRQKKEPEPVWL